MLNEENTIAKYLDNFKQIHKITTDTVLTKLLQLNYVTCQLRTAFVCSKIIQSKINNTLSFQ